MASPARIAAALAALATLLGATDADSLTIRVPQDAETVLDASDRASPGDTVLVGPGEWTVYGERWISEDGEAAYVASAAFLKLGVCLFSEEGAGATTLRVAEPTLGFPRTVVVVESGSGTTRIEGFTITGDGIGLTTSAPSRVEVRDCRFVDNGAGGLSGAYSDVLFDGCTFTGNHRIYYDGIPSGAVQIRFDARLEIRNSHFAGNLLAGVRAEHCESVVIEDCEFLDHVDHRAGFITYCNDVQIRRSRFIRNSIRGGTGGALTLGHSQGVVEFSAFAQDSSYAGYGGAIITAYSSFQFLNNTFVGCYTTVEGSAISIGGTGVSNFANNIVAYCQGAPALAKGGDPLPPASGCNVVWGNARGDYSGPWVPNPTDIPADPQLCDPATHDFRVHSTSICLPENSPGCGAIGAYGQGCGTISVEPSSWGKIKGLYH